MTEHIAELLPWYINGRLPLHDVERVTLHLEKCTQCTAELNMQQKIHAAINTPSKVEIAPQPSFNKLWDRIAAEEFGDELSASHHTGERTSWLRSMINKFHSQWMPFMLVTQTAAIAVLLGLMFVHRGEPVSPTDGYRTVTSTPVLDGIIIHVVFDDATRLADIKDILLRSNLQVASGPTPAGVYSLKPSDKSTNINVSNALLTLRDDPRVRFAELSHE